jgi:hypothetical protein
MKIELNDEHVAVIKKALESFSRFRMGQFKYGIEEAMMDKEWKDNRHDVLEETEKNLKDQFFPELSSGSHYGIGRDKEGDIAYEIHGLLKSYQICQQNVEPLEEDDLLRMYDSTGPLEISGVKLPDILEDYKYAYIKVQDSDIIEAFEAEDYKEMWELIQEANFPHSAKAKVIKDEDGKYMLKLQKPFYNKKKV